MIVAPGGPTLDYVREIRAEQLRQKRQVRIDAAGQNLANSIADLEVVFPWEAELRVLSPIVDKVSHLRAYWYRAGMRWVLYDCIPLALIPDDDEVMMNPTTSAADLHHAFRNKPPRELTDAQDSPISDLQHEFARRFKVFACPFWVLQGDHGGHQVKFSPWQQNVLIAKGLNADAPAIGTLPAAPFDTRTIVKLNHLNRLHAFNDRLDKLQASATVEFANVQMDLIQREIREAEMAFVESQMAPLVEMASSLRSKSAHQDQLIHVPGQAAKAVDAYAEYKETGNFTLKFTQH